MRPITWSFGLRLSGSQNAREHHFARRRRVATERSATSMSALIKLGPDLRQKVSFPCVVTMTRVGKKLCDTDNLASCFKSVRDELASMLGVTDGPTDTRVSWRYAQRTGPEYGVEISITSAAEEGRAATA